MLATTTCNYMLTCCCLPVCEILCNPSAAFVNKMSRLLARKPVACRWLMCNATASHFFCFNTEHFSCSAKVLIATAEMYPQSWKSNPRQIACSRSDTLSNPTFDPIKASLLIHPASYIAWQSSNVFRSDSDLLMVHNPSINSEQPRHILWKQM